MLSQITLLTCALFTAIYPLCFWVCYRDPLKNNFHHFHLGLPCVVGGILAVFLVTKNAVSDVTWLVVIWQITLFLISFFYYKKEYPNPLIITIPCLIGLMTCGIMVDYFLLGPSGWRTYFVTFVGGVIFCSSLFAMNLGHWYLNVHGLSIKYLKRSTIILGTFLLLRLIWNCYGFFMQKIIYDGDLVSLISFLNTTDGFLLYVALLFGTLFPLISLYFAFGTLKLKNTQATTGILYVILCSVLIGDIAYKYYLIKYGIAL